MFYDKKYEMAIIPPWIDNAKTLYNIFNKKSFIYTCLPEQLVMSGTKIAVANCRSVRIWPNPSMDEANMS